jgi:hypothetical protein
MTILYLVISQEDYDHSYSEHSIHCITTDEDKAYEVFRGVSTFDKAGKLLLKTDSNAEWQQPFALFDGLHLHPCITVLDQWRQGKY